MQLHRGATVSGFVQECLHGAAGVLAVDSARPCSFTLASPLTLPGFTGAAGALLPEPGAHQAGLPALPPAGRDL